MIDASLSIETESGRREVSLADYLAPQAEEQAHRDAYTWIKSLRNLPVDGGSFRSRFLARGDSLWWFTEIYLHKQQVILDIHRAHAAAEALIQVEAPRAIAIAAAPLVVQHVLPLVAAARRVRCTSPPSSVTWWRRIARLDLRARSLNWTARAARDRRRPATAPARPPAIAAFVHRAFWKQGGEEGSAESYIGPVLHELERRIGADAIRYIGIGPSTNFRTRRRLGGPAAPSNVIPVEQFAPVAALLESRRLWRGRYRLFGVLSRSTSLREAAIIRGVDCWPLVREQLAGIAWLQWPWSVRAMDEAGAALDALLPAVVLTYAEAGGWGRALVLEARRRGIRSVGLQHGFIYRHWLNYLHEPDELRAGREPGFPHPDVTLLFDEYAASHLREQGRLPAAALRVTGSPRLDELISASRALSPAVVADTRRTAGVEGDGHLLLVTTKEREARGSLAALLDAAARLPGVVTVIKPHPAETAESYSAITDGRAQVAVLSPASPLAPLLAAARAVVTVNSTVALDAAALDIPALAIGLPNNLSPFVEAGAIAGTTEAAELPEILQRILYDEEFRQQLAARRRMVLGRAATGSESRAASTSADAILALIEPGRREEAN